ncbi:hypothetical protein CFP56_015169 [Quercus suber]|uniref:Reverse transcriptase zinc-binding domain-containing protein n=1 Tax=Quercus suber TaxID=58331 RepID=A0AAW0KQE7_QUESU
MLGTGILISSDLPQAIKDSIRATPIQIFNPGEDSIIWSESKDGEFSTNSAYHLANPKQPSDNSFQGSWIWKIDMLPKIVHFMWLCHHNSILVRGVLASKGINCSAHNAPYEETIIHTLRDCNFAHMFWDKIRVPPILKYTFNTRTPQGAGGIPSKWKLRRYLLSLTNSLSPWKTLISTLVYPSVAVENTSDLDVGKVVFLGMIFVITLPSVSRPSDNGETSNTIAH